jgi:hypothetical protein
MAAHADERDALLVAGGGAVFIPLFHTRTAMVSSRATSVAAYLAELPADRRATLTTLITLIRKHMPKGYEEAMNWGMVCWQVPLSRYPITYNKQPLAYIALASQKQSVSLYLTGAYVFPEMKALIDGAFARAGKKQDMGKSCLRFRSLDDLPPLDFLPPVIARCTPDTLIEIHEAIHGKPGEPRGSRETKRAKAEQLLAKTAAAKKAAATTAKKTPAARTSATKPSTAATRSTAKSPAAKQPGATRVSQRAKTSPSSRKTS